MSDSKKELELKEKAAALLKAIYETVALPRFHDIEKRRKELAERIGANKV